MIPIDRYYAGGQNFEDKKCWWYMDYYNQKYCAITKKKEFIKGMPTNKPKYYKNDSFKKCNSCDEYIKKYKKR